MHRTPKTPTLSDCDLLHLILQGVIRIEAIFSSDPQLYVRGVLQTAHLNEQGGKKRIFGAKRWRWKVSYQGCCRRIVRSRLVWMAYHRRLIPPCHIIHHGELGPYFDGALNLELMHENDHRLLHYPDADFDPIPF